MSDSIRNTLLMAAAVIALSGCGQFKSKIAEGGFAATSEPPITNVLTSTATFTGCAAPSGVYANTYNATPSNFASLLAQAGPGDQILLASGNYAAISLTKKYTDFLTIAAAPGQTPVVAWVYMNGASHIAMKGLSIVGLRSSLTTGTGNFGVLVRVGSSDNIVFSGNVVASTTGDFPWQHEDVATEKNIDPAIAPSDGLNASNDYCVAITGNSFRNIFNAIYVGGNEVGTNGQNYLVANNTVDLFAGDAIDHSATNILIKGNQITNNIDICDLACVHNDGIQGWNWDDALGITNENVVIDSNVIVSQTIPILNLAGNDLHGITIYDGYWKNVSVTNNVVLTSSWTGISVSGVDGLNVINNTVVQIYLNGVNNHGGTGYPWILAGGTTHELGATSNAIIRNNIAQVIDVGTGVTSSDHNISLSAKDSPAITDLFTNLTTAMVQGDNLAGYDVSLLGTAATNPAIGTGSSSLMPAVNILGQPRSASAPTIGAY